MKLSISNDNGVNGKSTAQSRLVENLVFKSVLGFGELLAP